MESYLAAWERGDVDALAAMLAEDATFAMPPYPIWWRGREVIAAFAVEPVHRYLPTRANGQAASAAYRWDPRKGSYVAEALEVLGLEGTQIREMTAFMMPAVFQRFGLPAELPQGTQPRHPTYGPRERQVGAPSPDVDLHDPPTARRWRDDNGSVSTPPPRRWVGSQHGR